jgi:hypothetical protein
MANENVPDKSFKEAVTDDDNVNAAVSENDPAAGTTAGPLEDGEDPGQTMAQETADQLETAVEAPEEPVNDRLEPQSVEEADSRSAYNNPDRNIEGYQYDAPGEQTRGTFDVIDTTGETHEIARKEDLGGGVIVLVSTEGAYFIPHPSGGVQQYNEDIHGGGINANDPDQETVQDSEPETEPAEVGKPSDADLAAENLDEVRGIDRTDDKELYAPDSADTPSEMMVGKNGALNTDQPPVLPPGSTRGAPQPPPPPEATPEAKPTPEPPPTTDNTKKKNWRGK